MIKDILNNHHTPLKLQDMIIEIICLYTYTPPFLYNYEDLDFCWVQSENREL